MTPMRSQDHSTKWVPSPTFLRLVRVGLYLLTSVFSIGAAGVGSSVVYWYNITEGAIAPSWGSLIYLIILGFLTPVFLVVILVLVIPRLSSRSYTPSGETIPIENGGLAKRMFSQIGLVRSELLVLFAFEVLWVSAVVAYISDLDGGESCQWDAYWHAKKPDDFSTVCHLIDQTTPLAFTAYALITAAWLFETCIAVYIWLFLDQHVMSSPSNDMSGIAYRSYLSLRDELRAEGEKSGSVSRGNAERGHVRRPSLMATTSNLDLTHEKTSPAARTVEIAE